MSASIHSLGRRLGFIAGILLLITLYFLFDQKISHRNNPNQDIKTRHEGGSLIIELSSDAQGHYNLTGYVGRTPVDFLLDTGATLVAFPEGVARKAGLMSSGTRHPFNTANGVVEGYLVTVPSIRVGEVEIKNVEGAVLPSSALEGALLGMSFLRHLDLNQKDGVLILKVPE